MKEIEDLTVVIPCFNENPDVIYQTYTELVAQGITVIVVDDGDTMDLHQTINSIGYSPRMGYGYAIKEGIKHANTALICTMDGDGQHSPKDVVKLYTVYKMFQDCKMVIGQRWNVKEPFHRMIGRKVLNLIASLLNRHYMPDLNSGMRIFDRELAMAYSPILCNTFSFTTSLTMSIVTDGYKFTHFPIEVKPRAFGKSRVIVLKDGFVTLFYIFYIGLALRTRKIRRWMRGLNK